MSPKVPLIHRHPQARPLGDRHVPLFDGMQRRDQVIDQPIIGAVIGQHEPRRTGHDMQHGRGLQAQVVGAVKHARHARRLG